MPEWAKIFSLLQQFIEDNELPSISQIAEDNADPYRVLFSTIISLRTRDEVTLSASHRLFERAPDLQTLMETDEAEIAELIYPAAFYRNKAAGMKKCAAILLNEYSGNIPGDRDKLLKLPGVGRKTANLTLNLGFGINAICVDTHVHRISNRAGWVNTKTPDDTELALEKILPEKYWIPLNEILVSYGQKVCTPQSPHCSECVITGHCKRIDVGKSR
ncbi:MAG: endonuclease III [Spirochaetales bacterium]|uniref:Endonuclease III n=1 Tax=Candidatus Thalassospirochaeta sargassi TaxID=3119039 RepID=A0AAJ1MLW1_9SPIO|nr:endonuclease III [Spirochaetales bacterium]